MSLCDDLQAACTARTAAALRCHDAGDGRLLIAIADRTYSDGDVPELLVERHGDTMTMTDFGSVHSRLEDAGLNPNARGTARTISAIVKGYAIEAFSGELRVRCAADAPTEPMGRLLDAMIQLDALRVTAPSPRGPAFSRMVTTWLQGNFEDVEPSPLLLGSSGRDYRLTAGVGVAGRAPVYLQAVGGANDTRTVDHTFRVFSDINGHLEPSQKIAVLSEEVDPTDIRLLSQVGYVAGWWHLASLQAFLSAGDADSRVLFDEPSLL